MLQHEHSFFFHGCTEHPLLLLENSEGTDVISHRPGDPEMMASRSQIRQISHHLPSTFDTNRLHPDGVSIDSLDRDSGEDLAITIEFLQGCSLQGLDVVAQI